jgi:hypothetical protein
MIRPEHQTVGGQFCKSMRDIARFKRGTVAADQDDLLVAERRDLFRRPLEALGKTVATLLVHADAGCSCGGSGSKKVHVGLDTVRRRAEIEQWSQGIGKAAPNEIHLERISENEDGLLIHRITRCFFDGCSRSDAERRENNSMDSEGAFTKEFDCGAD